MKIIYPPLVEDSYSYFQEKKPKSLLYQKLVAQNIIDETGAPTKEALRKGWVKDFYEAVDLSFEKFLDLYPIFRLWSEIEFKKIEGFWEMAIRDKQKIQQVICKLPYDQKQQLMMYFDERGGI